MSFTSPNLTLKILILFEGWVVITKCDATGQHTTERQVTFLRILAFTETETKCWSEAREGKALKLRTKGLIDGL